VGRKLHIMLAVVALGLVAAPLLVLVQREYAGSRGRAQGGRVVRLAGRDWGFPSPFLAYPRGPGYLHTSLVFDTLIWKDEHGPVGLLAESWTVSKDNRRYTFRLRRNVHWQDGARLTAHDVAFSYEYLKRHGYSWVDLGVVTSAEALDDYTVVIETAEPYAPFLVDIAGSVPVIPKHIWEGVEDPWKFTGPKAAMGSGPFRLESYSKEHGTYSYVANRDYFFGRPRIERLQYVAVGDECLAMKTGEIDALMLWSRTVDALPEFQGKPEYKVLHGPGAWVLRLVFNHRDPVFGKRKVRRAVSLALDLDEIAERLRHGHVVPGSPGFLPPSSPWAAGDIESYRYDPEAARAMLSAADLPRKKYTLLTSPEYVREAEYVQAQARAVGLDLSVKSLPASTLDALLREGKFQIAITGHGGIGGDPDILRRCFCASGAPSGAEAAAEGAGSIWSTYGYDNRELNELGAAQLGESEVEKRRALVDKMQRIIARDVPTIALWYPKIYFAYRPEVFDGWFFTPGGISVGIPTAENKLVFVERKAR